MFLQDGQLEPFRQKHGLFATTQGILWLTAMRKGSKALDGITEDAPEGLTLVQGNPTFTLAGGEHRSLLNK